MVDISKILNKQDNEKNKQNLPEEDKNSSPLNTSPLSKDLSSIIVSVVNNKLDKANINDNPDIPDNFQEARDLALNKIKEISKAGSGFTSQDPCLGLKEAVEKIALLLSSGKKGLLKSLIADYLKNEEWLYTHEVNVGIISLKLGLGLGYDLPRLINLGVGAFLHDLGLSGFPDAIKGSAQEEILKSHPDTGASMLKKINPEINYNILAVIQQEHERLDGTGYPRSLKGTEINEYAQIVGLADVYELLLHKVSDHGKLTSMEIMKKVLALKEGFLPETIRALIKGMGVFPVSSIVRLSSKEIGVVYANNSDSPFSPIIDVVFDADGRELGQPKRVNLTSDSMIFIEDSINT